MRLFGLVMLCGKQVGSTEAEGGAVGREVREAGPGELRVVLGTRVGLDALKMWLCLGLGLSG